MFGIEGDGDNVFNFQVLIRIQENSLFKKHEYFITSLFFFLN